MPTTPKPRLLFMTSVPFYQWRGSSIRIAYNVQALAELGYQVDLVTLPIGEARDIPGVTVHRVANPFRQKTLPIGPSLAKAFFDVLIFFKALRLSRRHSYAVVHSVEEVGLLGLIIARISGGRAVFEKHSDPASHQDKPLKNLVLALYRRVEALAIRKSDAVIGTGEGLVKQALAIAPGQIVHHIFDIPSSLVEADPDRVKEIADKVRQHPDEVIALYVGSFAVYQGIDLMFESLPIVLRATPQLRLLVVGGTEEQIAQRTAWLKERGLESAVSFVGFIAPDNVPNYIAAADILLSPRSSGINTPLKLLDYLKGGRAILATDTLANRRILADNTALLTRPTPEAFASGMIELTVNEPRRKELGRQGQKLLKKTYNFPRFKLLLKNCYDRLSSTKAYIGLIFCDWKLFGYADIAWFSAF